MIAMLTGRLVSKRPPELLIDVHGVTYECSAPLSSFYSLGEVGATVTVHTQQIVREDAQLLFAFASLEEKFAFRQLIKVSGVGPKVALSVLSGLSVEDLARAVAVSDVSLLTKIPGIGRKTAERIVVDLKDRALTQAFTSDSAVNTASPRAEAMAALTILGYKDAEVNRMLQAIDASLPAQEQIRLGLQGTLRR
jgi:holliday junction DNA helicase RuvA